MKSIALILLVCLFGCVQQAPDYKSKYLEVIAKVETIKSQQQQIEQHLIVMHDSIVELHDSIEALNERPLMTSEQFMEIYKYQSLRKYYRICVNNPTQWKYYKGWSSRIFEQQ